MNRALTMATIAQAAPDQVSCDLNGESAILSLKSGVYYGLNRVGARIWALLQEPISLGALRDQLAREYAVEAGQCERDVLALLERLRAEGLVELREGAAA